jgi:hypothetical protein
MDETTQKSKRPVKKSAGPVIKPSPMTIEQFRSYLRGIMFVGGEGWCPNQKQWEAIVEIIDNLQFDPSSTQTAPTTTQVSQVVPAFYPPQPMWTTPPAQSMIEPPAPVDPNKPLDGPYKSEFI